MAIGRAEREGYLTRYGAGPALLRQAWSEVPAEARQWRPGEGKWSAQEVVVHCADSETYGATRIRLLLAEKEPLIVGYDEGAWAKTFDYHSHDVELALRTIEAVRSHTVTMLRRLPEEAWNRVGRHTHSGEYSDADWLRIYAEHLEVHARQIRRNIQGWTAAAPRSAS
ncbi:MAG: DinB family protein [Acidobacteriota bacterium]|nr:DinB family protein [Acidobacteriota bacterium]